MRIPLLAKIMVAPLLSGLLLLGLLSWQASLVQRTQGTARVMNLAGSERMRLYRLALLAQRYATTGQTELKRAIQAELRRFATILQSLNTGNAALGLHGIRNQSLQRLLTQDLIAYRQYLDPLFRQLFQHGRRTSIVAAIRRVTEHLVGEVDHLVQLLQGVSESNHARITLAIKLFMLASAMIAAGSLAYVYLIVVHPLRQFVAASHALVQGDTSVPLPWRAGDEIGDLARAFDHMRRTLARQQAQLRNRADQTEQRLTHLLQGVDAILWEAVVDSEGCQFSFIDDRAIGLSGLPLECWYEKGFFLSHISVPDRRDFARLCTTLLSDQDRSVEATTWERDYRFRTATGRQLWLRLRFSTVAKDPDGRIHLAGTMRDVTDHKRMERRSQHHLQLRRDLERALEERQFVLHYQPQMELTSGRISTVEALLRWQHPQRGLVAPDEFIPVLENSGLIVPVGEWILEEACRQHRAWIDMGIPPVNVSVNLSARQLRQSGIVRRILHILEQQNMDPAYLRLELTETMLVKRIHIARQLLRELVRRRITIELDDFGTGYSSLAYLAQLPVDTLKIDRSFIDSLPEHADVVQAIMEMGHRLQLQIVAEGVETPAQLRFLQRHGCDRIQGYLLSKPRPGPELAELLRNPTPLSELRGGDEA